jgi:hypothetical protein
MAGVRQGIGRTYLGHLTQLSHINIDTRTLFKQSQYIHTTSTDRLDYHDWDSRNHWSQRLPSPRLC